jgi:UDP-N-acetylmuramoyl-L-alanyl-D-glutamate--2,6-diaminopimelate ligase
MRSSGPPRCARSRVGYVAGGLCFELHEGERVAEVRTTLIGDYNVSNLLP